MKPLLLLLLLCSQSWAQRMELRERKPTHDQIVIVECKFQNRTGHGTGVLIDPQRVLTALHVVHSNEMTVVHNNEEHVADVDKAQWANDWVLLRLRKPIRSAVIIPIRQQPLNANEEVTAFGYGGNYQRASKRLFYFRSRVRGTELVGTQPVGGDSGGPILDAAGMLVSIVSDKDEDSPAWRGYGLGTNELAEFVK